MIKISFWLKTVACSFPCILFVFGIFGFNNSEIENTIIKNINAAETSCKGPADVILVIDRSASMDNFSRFSIAKTASNNFIDKLFAASPDDIYSPNDYHQIGLVAFHNLIDNEELNGSGDYMKSVINQSDGILGDYYPLGYRRTSLAISTANNSLDVEFSSSNPSATKTMIIITDGPPHYNPDDAIAFADNAKSDGIRVISIGLKLDSISDEPGRTEAEETEAEEFIKNVASAPFDCYYASDSGGELAGCNSISADNLVDALDEVYTSITAAICDEDPPAVSISREPSGTLYSVDNLIITSTATDDVGFNSHSIRWSDDWSDPDTIQIIECGDLAGTEIECSTGNLGPFSSSTSINYRSSVTDANDNEASIELPDPRSVTVANVILTVPALLRNKDNIIKAVISNYGGNDNILVSIDAPVLDGIEIDKATMTTTDSGSTRTYSYTFNPGCDWTDGITNGSANNINVDIYFYAQSDDVGIRQIASSENNILASSFERNSSLGTCTDGLNNDCDYKDNDPLKPIIDLNPGGLDEALCDITNPTVGILRNPAGDVYNDDSITFTSNATDPNGIKQHTIYYKIDSGSPQVAFDCNDANADSLCDEDISKNINNISAVVGLFNAGEEIDYYSTAIDYSGNNNTNSTIPESFIVKNRECEGVVDLGDCLVTLGGKCCGGVCNAAISDENLYDPDCAKESCEGIAWELVANFDSFIDNQPCSNSEGDLTGCFSVTPDPIILPSIIPTPYSSDGCEIRDYICGAGYCNYGDTEETRKMDSCRINSLTFDDFECVTSQICDSINNWEDNICDSSISYTNLTAEDNIGVSILSQTEVSDSKTPVTLNVFMRDDESGIASCNLKWRKNGGVEQNINCLQGGIPCPAGGDCNYSEVIGPFVDRDFVEYSVTFIDGNDNIENVPISGWYSFTTRDECYYISDNYESKIDVTNLTDCNLNNGECCGGHCDSSRTESSVYDDECTVDACSGESWIESNTNELGETLNNIICGSVDTCFDYYSPVFSSPYSGCITGGNKCSFGQCAVVSSSTFVPACNGNLLTNYDCSPDNATGTCQPKDSNIDCSAIGDYDSDTVACNCDCNNYDIEEKVYSSLSFDGMDDYISTGKDLIGDYSGTIEVWANTKTLEGRHFISHNGIGAGWGPGPEVSLVQSSSYMYFYYHDGGLSLSAPIPAVDEWHHWVVIWDNTEAIMYLDGAVVDTDIWSGGPIDKTGWLDRDYYGFNIGTYYLGWARNWYGLLDEMRVYDRALYPEEVLDHYNGMFADDTGLVGHWDFDPTLAEEENGIVGDRSGNGNDGTLSSISKDGILYNGAEWIDGRYGKAIKFDGINDYVRVADSNSLTLENYLTIEAWFKPGAADFSGNNYLIYKYNGIDGGYLISISDNQIRFWKRGSGLSSVYTNDLIWEIDKWYYITISIDTVNDTAAVYRNGDSLELNYYQWPTGSIGDVNLPLDIGGRGLGGSSSGNINGTIDDVRIYDRAISETEAGEHYYGAFNNNTGLVGYWDFNEGTGTVAYDSSENGPQWVKYGNGDDEDENGNVIDVLNRNVPAPWQVCTDTKDNDCDGDINDYDEDNDTGASNCDGEVDQVLFTATDMDRDCVTDETCTESSDVFPVGNVIIIDDIDIERAENDFTIETLATDEFLIKEVEIEWTTDNWVSRSSKNCNNTGICEVCVEGGTCGEDNDDILSSSLSAGNVFSFRICAWDNSVNSNQKCTDYYNIVIENSNSVPEITSLSIRNQNFCADGLEYILEWIFNDSDGDTQASYEIQIKEGDNDFSTGLLVDIKKDLPSYYYQILSSDFEGGKETEYGNKVYFWQLRVTDSRGGGYKRTSEWVEYNDLTDSDGDGNSTTFTTPMYKYPQVDFSAISDSGSDCLYETSYEHTGAEVKCDFGENIMFSDESVFVVNCDNPDDSQCVNLNAVNCDVGEGQCVSCLIDDDCSKFNSGGVSYSCVNEVCEASGSCVDDNDCQAADVARCDIDIDTGIGLCVGCDDDSQCSNDKFGTTGVDYFCSSIGACEDKDRWEWYFYGIDTGDPDSIDPNPINNYIESESKTYNVIFKVKDIVGNSCYEIKKILLGGRDYPKWNESSTDN